MRVRARDVEANTKPLGREKFALITSVGKALAIGEIVEVVPYADRFAVQGPALSTGHPAYVDRIGKPARASNNSQNQVC